MDFKEPKKILVVDDERLIREELRYRLSRRGFEVATAKNEKEFSERAFLRKPDLIILDIWLENGIGTETYRELLQNGFDPEVPVIYMTALVEGYPKENPAGQGRKCVLYSKPFDFEKLVEEIHSLLDEKRERLHEGSWDEEAS